MEEYKDMREYGKKESFFARIKSFFVDGESGEETAYEESEFEEFPQLKKRWSLRLHSPKDTPIYLKHVSSFDKDAEEPANKLREGCIIIVNLEKADEETARRTIDFLSGVAFGIQGNHKKMGEKIFLFVPPGYSITDISPKGTDRL